MYNSVTTGCGGGSVPLYLLVNIVLGGLHLRHILRVSDEPEDLIAGKRQGHENKQGLKGFDWRTGKKGRGKLGESLRVLGPGEPVPFMF